MILKKKYRQAELIRDEWNAYDSWQNKFDSDTFPFFCFRGKKKLEKALSQAKEEMSGLSDKLLKVQAGMYDWQSKVGYAVNMQIYTHYKVFLNPLKKPCIIYRIILRSL